MHHRLLATAVLLGAGLAGLSTPTPAAIRITEYARFSDPWAMTFLPDGRLLVTEQRGVLKIYEINGPIAEISGVPTVHYAGHGGLGDIALHPGFAENRWVYLSYAEPDGPDLRRAAVARATLVLDGERGGRLENLEVIWRQDSVFTTEQYGHRIAFGPDGYLWISSGERSLHDPAQDLDSNLGKILRLRDDGTVPPGNPFAERGGVAAQVWSYGHRNPLGLAFDAAGQLWTAEMGPGGGDELNRVVRGANYGYPIVSNGSIYYDRTVPTHAERPEFEAPVVSWTPVISPASMMIYDGSEFPEWRGNAFIAALSTHLVRVEFDGETAHEAERFEIIQRVRDVKQGPDGAIWILGDEAGGWGGWIQRISAR